MSLRLSRRFVFSFSFFETALVSVVVAGLVSSWYPTSYFDLFGVKYKLFGFFAVLMLLGPVLAFLFYKSDHEVYVNDLSLIYIVKLCVLFLGLHLAYSQRPVLVVFSVDRLVVVQANQIPLEQVPPGILKMTLIAEDPPLIAAKKLPEDDLDLLMEVMSGGADIEYRPAQYESFNYQRKGFYQRMCRLDLSNNYEKPAYKAHCESIRVPLMYKGDRFATAVFDAKDSNIKDIDLQDPW